MVANALIKKGRLALLLSLFGVVYLLAHRLSQYLMFEHDSVITVWITIGIVLSIYLLVPRKYWLYLWTVSFVIDLIYYCFISSWTELFYEQGFAVISNTDIVLILLIQRIAQVFLPLAIALTISKTCGEGFSFNRVRDVLVFSGSSLVLTFIMYTSEFGTVILSKVKTTYLTETLHGALPTLLGIVVIVPVVMGVTHIERSILKKPDWRKFSEMILLFVTIVSLAHLLISTNRNSYPLIMEFIALLYPVIIWSVFRFNPRVTALVLFELILVLVIFTGHRYDSAQIIGASLSRNVFSTQAILIFSIIFSLVLSAILAERRSAEEKLKSAIHSLSEMNESIKAFDYSVSNALRAPVRRIDAMFGILLNEGDIEESEKTERKITSIQNNLGEIRAMLDSLSWLSRATMQSNIQVDDVDLSLLARIELQKILSEYPNRRVEYHVEDGLHVRGDEQLLSTALYNLFDNAVKFSSEKPKSIITVGSMDNGSVFYVRDNGIGFESAGAKTLFSPFHNFHSAESFTGTGLGLAIVQRIIHSHGGTIRAESSPGQGSTFYFTLAC